jgi:hypothetical protein
VEILRLPACKNHANRKYYIFLLTQMPFISSSYLIALDRTSRNILNGSSEDQHPCLGADSRGFFHLIMIITVGHSGVAFIMLR